MSCRFCPSHYPPCTLQYFNISYLPIPMNSSLLQLYPSNVETLFFMHILQSIHKLCFYYLPILHIKTYSSESSYLNCILNSFIYFLLDIFSEDLYIVHVIFCNHLERKEYQLSLLLLFIQYCMIFMLFGSWRKSSWNDSLLYCFTRILNIVPSFVIISFVLFFLCGFLRNLWCCSHLFLQEFSLGLKASVCKKKKWEFLNDCSIKSNLLNLFH